MQGDAGGLINLLIMSGRIGERLLIVLAGMLAMWLGYRLFKVVAEAESAGTFEFKGAKVQLQRVGPGVFFALFGASLMGYALASSAEISTQPVSEARQTVSRYMNVPGYDDPQAGIIAAINTVALTSEVAKQRQLNVTELDRLAKAVAVLALVKNRALDDKFGDGTSGDYNLIRKMCSDGSSECRGYLRNKNKEKWYTEVDEFATKEIEP